jgi:hypothetical protein
VVATILLDALIARREVWHFRRFVSGSHLYLGHDAPRSIDDKYDGLVIVCRIGPNFNLDDVSSGRTAVVVSHDAGIGGEHAQALDQLADR